MIAILADIHGNYPALEAVLDDMPCVSEVWVVGDFVTGVPYPNEVLDRLLELPMPVYSVLGNHDETLLLKRGIKKGKQFGIFEWVEGNLKPHHWDFLEGLPKILNVGRDVLLYHGTPDKLDGAIITQNDAEQAAETHKYKWLIGGHRHQFKLFSVGEQKVMIPGSVGISINRIGGLASYALLDEQTGKYAFRHVSYDACAVVCDMDKSPIMELAPGITSCLKKELLTGRLYMMSLVRFAFWYEKKQLGYRPDEVPFDLWDEAEKKWDGSEFTDS